MEIEINSIVKHKYTGSLWAILKTTKKSVCLAKFRKDMINAYPTSIVNKKKFLKRYIKSDMTKVLYGR